MSIKITMNLTENGVANTDKISEILKTKTRTQAVETALSISAIVLDRLKQNGEVILVNKRGEKERLVIPGI